MSDPGLDIPQDEHALMALLALVDLDVDQVHRDYFRREGSRRAILGFRFNRKGQSGRGYFKLYGSAKRSQEVLAKWRSLKIRDGEFGPGLRALPEHRGLVFLFPNDAGLRDLSQAADLDKLKRLMTEAGLFPGMRIRGSRSHLEISRYKPEHRLVGFLDLALKDDLEGESRQVGLVMRLFADRRGEHIANLVRTLSDAGLGRYLPQQQGCLLDGRLQFEERLVGTELLTGRETSVAEILELLERFSAAEAADLQLVSPSALSRLRIADIRAMDRPEFAPLIDRIEDAIAARGPFAGRLGLVHGDLHPRQFIVGPDRVGLIDLERCARSLPSLDLGHFLTELEISARETPETAGRAFDLRIGLEAGWLRSRNADEARSLALGMALGRLAAAARTDRRFEDGDRAMALIAEDLEAALAILEGLDSGPRREWTRLHPRSKGLWPAWVRPDGGSDDLGGLYDPGTERFWPILPSCDDALPGLGTALPRGRLVGWRPGQRAIVATREGSFLKILPPSRIEGRLATIETLLACPGAEELLPRLIDGDRRLGIFEIEGLPGETLHAMLERGDESGLEAAGAALARFHDLQPMTALEHAATDDVDRFLEHAAAVHPDLQGDLFAARRATPEPITDFAAVPIHGDMHDKNFIVAGERARIIDIEGSRSGPAARDIGNLTAHIELRRRQHDRPAAEFARRSLAIMTGYSTERSLPDEGIEVDFRRSLFRLACVYLLRRQHIAMARELIGDIARGLVLLFGVVLLSGCVALVPADDTLESAAGELRERLSPRFINKKDTVEIQGSFTDGVFGAERIEIEEDDGEIELKANIASVSDGVVKLGTIDFVVAPESLILDENGSELDLDALRGRVGEFAKAEGVERNGIVVLRKISLRRRAEGERDRLQARVESIDLMGRSLVVGGVEVDYDREVPVYWDVPGQPAPTADERGLRPENDPRLRLIVRVDDDDRRNETGLQVADWLSVGGEVQWDMEWRKNHNLRDDRKRDRLVHEVSAKLELSFDLDDRLFAFTQLRAARDFEVFDQSTRLEFGTTVAIEQAFVVAFDFPLEGMALEIGRQKFDQGREWLMDDDIDGLRLFWNLEAALLQLSVSQQLFDESPEEDGVTNLLAAAHLEVIPDTELFIYALHRGGGRLVDLDRWHFGVSLETEIEDFSLFLDAGYVVGKENDLEVEGYGFDIMAMYTFKGSLCEPSIYLGVAYGSGDDDLSDGKDSSFRQSGLNDNNDKFNGVTSFRYLGELVRPELSNLMVITTGFGFRLMDDTSVDLVFHNYRQVEAFPGLRDTRLRLDPLGRDRGLGSEFDLVIGLEDWHPLEIEIVIGWFLPGRAFESGADEAWFMTFQAEWNF